jgi:hexosaminidase
MLLCRQSNPNITAWMAMMGYTDYAQVETYYQLKLIQIVRGILSNRFIIWQDPIDNNADVGLDQK